ncbi:MAG: hypothetical protein KAR23_04735 [Candidatus Aenigmarchaeota archaeon]|nr:hypothetical protein [Candidatus Aenigmarchaeota archaeon]
MRDSYLNLTDKIFTDAELYNLANQCDFDPAYLLEQITKVIEIAGRKELNLYGSPIIELFDMQGPPDERLIGDHKRWEDMKNALLLAKRNPNELKVIGSGWDGASVEYIINEKLGGVMKYAIVERGAAILEIDAASEDDDCVYDLYPLGNPEDLYEIEKNMLIYAAELELALGAQGNVSKSSNCFYVEANSLERGNLREHFLVKRRGNPSTKDIYYAIDHSEFDTSGFTYEDEKIKFKPTIKNTEILHFILSEVYTLQSVRFAEEEGDKISIRRDNEDNTDFALKDINGFTEATISDEWDVEIKKDFCADIIKTNNGIRPTKEYAADYFGKIAFGGTDFILAHFGDEISDVFELKNALPFILENSDAGKYCIDKGIGHVTVKNVIEYFLIMTAITDKAIKNKIQTRPTPMVNIETTFL